MDAIVNRLAEIESAAAAIVKHAEEEKDELNRKCGGNRQNLTRN